LRIRAKIDLAADWRQALQLPRTPTAVAIDLDGTLIDSEALIQEAYCAVAPAVGVSMSAEQFLSLVGLHREANDAHMRKLYGDDFPLEKFYAAARAYIGDRVAPLKAGVKELMDTLEENQIPRALVTSSAGPWVERHLAAHALTDRLHAVVTRADVVNGKPHPEPYLKAAAALSVSPESALALEDSYAGVRSAHAAGFMTVMVPDLLQPSDEMRAKTVGVIASLQQLNLVARRRRPND
jgi:HAD superfamily hydrolase (TIGR01509 family)